MAQMSEAAINEGVLAHSPSHFQRLNAIHQPLNYQPLNHECQWEPLAPLVTPSAIPMKQLR